MKTATLIQENLPNFGSATLYRLDPPMSYPSNEWDAEIDDFKEEEEKAEYVAVSTSSFFGLETYIFHTDEHGVPKHWTELPGSEKGTSSHACVLGNAGYEIKGSE